MIIGVSGHRPQKTGGSDFDLMLLAQRAILREKPDSMVIGMATGWDQAVARACHSLGAPFTAAVPFEGQEHRWPDHVKAMYFALLQQAAKVVYVSTPGYHPAKMAKRNQWIVDHCDKMLVLYDGMGDSGTADAVERADRAGLEVTNCWQEWLAER